MRYLPVVLVGRTVRALARLRKRGGGAAIPGLVVNTLSPRFLASSLSSFPRGVVFVTGTAGKSTTTRVLSAIVRAHGMRVFTNPSTANIAQGLTSSVIATCSLTGRIDADIAILEVDEGHAAKLADAVSPDVSVLLNVCVDQIDRFFDPELVVDMLRRVARRTKSAIVVNHDDASCVAACGGATAPLRTFGMSDELFARHGLELGYVSARQQKSSGPASMTRLDSVSGDDASITVAGASFRLRLPSQGIHYGIDLAAAIEASRVVLGSSMDMEIVERVLRHMQPVFGRGEIVTVNGEEINFVLVQNPISYQLNVGTIPPETEQILVAIGSDVRDYAYLWGAHIQSMPPISVVTGPRCYDVALHAHFSGVPVGDIQPDLVSALEAFLAMPIPARGRKTIIFSADSMRRIRHHLRLPEQVAA